MGGKNKKFGRNGIIIILIIIIIIIILIMINGAKTISLPSSFLRLNK